MSGSGHQNERSLIAEIKDTLRLHFKGAQCFSLSAPPPTGLRHDIDVDLTPALYGGSLDFQKAPVCNVPLTWEAEIHSEPLQIVAALNIESGVVTVPTIHAMPIFSPRRLKIHTEHGVRFKRTIHSLPIKPLKTWAGTWERRRWKIETVVYRRFREALTGFAQATLIRVKLLNQTEAYKRSRHKLLFPLTRYPISVYRFNKAHRDIFRQHLSEKAGVLPDQIKITQVYDRMILGVLGGFQTSEDGQLLCHPKLEAFKATRDQSRNIPVYLVRGETLTPPRQKIQTIVPMSALQS